LAAFLVVFAFNFLTLRPGQSYGPGLYAGLVLNLLAMLAVVGLVIVLVRKIRA
jgi:hypothetical protein